MHFLEQSHSIRDRCGHRPQKLISMDLFDASYLSALEEYEKEFDALYGDDYEVGDSAEGPPNQSVMDLILLNVVIGSWSVASLFLSIILLKGI